MKRRKYQLSKPIVLHGTETKLVAKIKTDKLQIYLHEKEDGYKSKRPF